MILVILIILITAAASAAWFSSVRLNDWKDLMASRIDQCASAGALAEEKVELAKLRSAMEQNQSALLIRIAGLEARLARMESEKTLHQ